MAGIIVEEITEKILGKLWHGISEEQASKYCMGVYKRDSDSAKNVINQLAEKGFADAVLMTMEEVPELKPDKESVKKGFSKVLERVWHGYSEETLRDYIENFGDPEMVESVVRRGFVEALEGIDIREMSIDRKISKDAIYEGLGKVTARVGKGYSREDLDEFMKITGLNYLLK